MIKCIQLLQSWKQISIWCTFQTYAPINGMTCIWMLKKGGNLAVGIFPEETVLSWDSLKTPTHSLLNIFGSSWSHKHPYLPIIHCAWQGDMVFVRDVKGNGTQVCAPGTFFFHYVGCVNYLPNPYQAPVALGTCREYHWLVFAQCSFYRSVHAWVGAVVPTMGSSNRRLSYSIKQGEQ